MRFLSTSLTLLIRYPSVGSLGFLVGLKSCSVVGRWSSEGAQALIPSNHLEAVSVADSIEIVFKLVRCMLAGVEILVAIAESFWWHRERRKSMDLDSKQQARVRREVFRQKFGKG